MEVVTARKLLLLLYAIFQLSFMRKPQIPTHFARRTKMGQWCSMTIPINFVKIQNVLLTLSIKLYRPLNGMHLDRFHCTWAACNRQREVPDVPVELCGVGEAAEDDGVVPHPVVPGEAHGHVGESVVHARVRGEHFKVVGQVCGVARVCWGNDAALCGWFTLITWLQSNLYKWIPISIDF